MFASGGRAYPDISLLGHAYPTLDGGHWYPVSGTSASAPLVAGMLTLINGERISRGQPAVGFVNPALYALAANATTFRDTFHDIVRLACPLPHWVYPLTLAGHGFLLRTACAPLTPGCPFVYSS